MLNSDTILGKLDFCRSKLLSYLSGANFTLYVTRTRAAKCGKCQTVTVAKKPTIISNVQTLFKLPGDINSAPCVACTSIYFSNNMKMVQMQTDHVVSQHMCMQQRIDKLYFWPLVEQIPVLSGELSISDSWLFRLLGGPCWVQIIGRQLYVMFLCSQDAIQSTVKRHMVWCVDGATRILNIIIEFTTTSNILNLGTIQKKGNCQRKSQWANIAFEDCFKK